MVYNNIEFFNVEDLEQKSGLPGLFLQRFPAKLRSDLGVAGAEVGRFTSQTSAGCEIRFCTNASFVRISLSSWEADTTVTVCIGDFFHSVHEVKKGVINTIHIDYPDKFRTLAKQALTGHRFSPNVWRIIFGVDACCAFNGLDTGGHAVRPPKDEELPKHRIICYGSSITMGVASERYLDTFVPRIGKMVGADVYNKGIPGACLIEPSICDYVINSKFWTAAILELGVNMLIRFSPEDFERRVAYFLERISMLHKPVLVTGIFTSFATYTMQAQLRDKTDKFNKAVERVASRMQQKGIYYISGEDALSDFSALCCDLVHPSDDGHLLIAQKMSAKIKTFLH